jgi:hypothetical protein
MIDVKLKEKQRKKLMELSDEKLKQTIHNITRNVTDIDLLIHDLQRIKKAISEIRTSLLLAVKDEEEEI